MSSSPRRDPLPLLSPADQQDVCDDLKDLETALNAVRTLPGPALPPAYAAAALTAHLVMARRNRLRRAHPSHR